MRILTWNCNGAFRKKHGLVSILGADICIIQECENPAESKDLQYISWASNYVWIGDTKNKGLGIFAKPEIKLEKLHWTNQYKDHTVKHFLPCRINENFNLLAVWTHKNNSPNFGYVGQLWKYLQVNKQNLNPCIVVGDFNSNAIWDEWDRWWNHSDVVNELSEIGIKSFYHKFTNEEQGQESQPTLYFQRNISRPYHIDYIFGSEQFSEQLIDLKIGKFKNWIIASDHMPIICEFKH